MIMFMNVQNPRMTRISFASRSKFKICLLKGGVASMSSESICFSLGENFPKIGVVNVHGKKGTGKTTYFNSKDFIKFDHEILKSKEKTIDFIEMMRFSKFPLVLDDYELVENLPGTKEIFSPKCLLIIITHEKLSSVTSSYEFPGVPVEVFAKSLLRDDVKFIEELLNKADGNMTAVRLDLENFNSTRDVFFSSKEYVSELIHAQKNKLPEYIDRHLTEHGNTLGIIHENYTDYCGDEEEMYKISESLSDADIIDMKIYSEVSWDLMNYFNVSACLIPALYMDKSELLDKGIPLDKSEPLDKGDLRPGSIWTKTSNMLMKRNRFKRLRIQDRDEIQLWVMKANSGEELHPKFDSYDLDSINQLAFTKIKSKVLTTLKKKCPKKD